MSIDNVTELHPAPDPKALMELSAALYEVRGALKLIARTADAAEDEAACLGRAAMDLQDMTHGLCAAARLCSRQLNRAQELLDAQLPKE